MKIIQEFIEKGLITPLLKQDDYEILSSGFLSGKRKI